MGQILPACARTTETIRLCIQNSQASSAKLAERNDLNPKTIAKWKQRDCAQDMPMGPRTKRSTVLSLEEEAAMVAFRQHTL